MTTANKSLGLERLLIPRDGIPVSGELLADNIEYIQGQYNEFNGAHRRLHAEAGGRTLKKLYLHNIPNVSLRAHELGYDGSNILTSLVEQRFMNVLNALVDKLSRYKKYLDYDSLMMSLKSGDQLNRKDGISIRIVAGDDEYDLSNLAYRLRECAEDLARIAKAQIEISDPKQRLETQIGILDETGAKYGYGGGRNYPQGYRIPHEQFSQQYWERVEKAIKPLFINKG